jgi:alcohol dehydrogenase (cytochrome c)/quinohemoprotein ethanol dehydrogenase
MTFKYSVSKLTVALLMVINMSVIANKAVATNDVDLVAGVKNTFSRINSERLRQSDAEPSNWMAIGRDNREQFYSPLNQIDTTTVKNLGLAWFFDLDTNRGQQATPLIVDGVMYFSTAWSKVKALEAVTGRLIWEFDPKADPIKVAQACCDAVNRGVALWDDKVYVATLDGRLIALEASSGKVVWEAMTIPENSPYTITGAPRAAKGLVFIGNGGAEYGARGYVTAYDAQTGVQKWRFYTVPGDPSRPQENSILEMARSTWNGEWWKNGGGGTVWDAIVYDQELDQLYLGVGNGGPHNPALRSPGGGDNLFVGSIVALNPDTGDYLWHFQATPEDAWDYTSTQPIVLADLLIGGEKRKVLMQAPKNGFFYVIDRKTGEFISGEAFAKVNWAKGLDKNGQPIVNKDARYYQTGKPFLGRPGPGGAHNWQPMAYHPGTGYVYIPVTESPAIFSANIVIEGKQNPVFNDVADVPVEQQVMLDEMRKTIVEEQRGFLLAWDPVGQKEVWRAEFESQFNGGVLATAGDLVFAGSGNGEFEAFAADTGEKLWSYATYGGIVAAPSTYSVNGEQYVTVIQGWGGGFALVAGNLAQLTGPKRNISRVLTFKLGATQELIEPAPESIMAPPARIGTAKNIAIGQNIFKKNCSRCHGANAISGGTVPDLRLSPMIHSPDAFLAIVRGALLPRGMPSFDGLFTTPDIESIRAYLVSEANNALSLQTKHE